MNAIRASGRRRRMLYYNAETNRRITRGGYGCVRQMCRMLYYNAEVHRGWTAAQNILVLCGMELFTVIT